MRNINGTELIRDVHLDDSKLWVLKTKFTGKKKNEQFPCPSDKCYLSGSLNSLCQKGKIYLTKVQIEIQNDYYELKSKNMLCNHWHTVLKPFVDGQLCDTKIKSTKITLWLKNRTIILPWRNQAAITSIQGSNLVLVIVG